MLVKDGCKIEKVAEHKHKEARKGPEIAVLRIDVFKVKPDVTEQSQKQTACKQGRINPVGILPCGQRARQQRQQKEHTDKRLHKNCLFAVTADTQLQKNAQQNHTDCDATKKQIQHNLISSFSQLPLF